MYKYGYKYRTKYSYVFVLLIGGIWEEVWMGIGWRIGTVIGIWDP